MADENLTEEQTSEETDVSDVTETTQTDTSTENADTDDTNTGDIEYSVEFRDGEKGIENELKDMFRSVKLSDDNAKALTKSFYELQDKLAEKLAEQSKKDLAEWNAEQGDDLAKNQELARRGSAALGLSEDEIATVERSLGTKAFMNLCLRQGSMLAEDNSKGMGGSQASTDVSMSTADFYKSLFDNERV